MTCHKVKSPGGRVVAIICGPDSFVNLEPYGAKVWCEDHNYIGPHFFRSENAIAEIRTPSRKTWDAYVKWRESLTPTPHTKEPTP